MAFKTKSLSDLVRVCENELSVQFYGESSVLRKSVLKVLAAVLGGALYMMSLLAVRIWRDRFVSTCGDDSLDGFGTEYGIPHKAPLYARGNVLISISGNSPQTLPQGVALVDESTGLEYEVSADTEISGKDVEVPVVATAYGAKSNLENGAELSFRDGTPDGLSESVSVVRISGGESVAVEIGGETQIWGESADAYRARLLSRIQNPPAGGSAEDYRRWAMRFSFVSDAFVFPNFPKTNSVSVALANYESGIELDEKEVGEVRDYIAGDVRRPVTADVRVFSVSSVPVEVVASVSPFTESVKGSVKTSLERALRKCEPGKSVSMADLELAVLSGSTAETFVVSDLKKNGTLVSKLSLGLYEDAENGIVAETAELDLTLRNGEA